MRSFAILRSAGVLLVLSVELYAQFPLVVKLVGSGAVGKPQQGHSVALSADGNTAIVGGLYDDGGNGAAWVFVRTGATWTQQGPKLVGSGADGPARQGSGVALSADGNTALVGGVFDGGGAGAAWVFTRTNGVWTQEGAKLVGSGVLGVGSNQGVSVALSADGNTALVGGWADDFNRGATWVFTRSGGVWSEGPKLVASDAVGEAQQGFSVSLSADGNTALIGGLGDNANTGAAWVFTRTGPVWTQQGPKLVGTGIGASPGPNQGISVDVSADGNTAMVGGMNDNGYRGAAWVFVRSGTVWTQQGPKLVGTGAIGTAQQGASVSLSADGNTAVMGGYTDNNLRGAMWAFKRVGGAWQQVGKFVGAGGIGTSGQGTAISISAEGETVLVGGFPDNVAFGAAWVFQQPGEPTAIPMLTGSFMMVLAGILAVIALAGIRVSIRSVAVAMAGPAECPVGTPPLATLL